MANTKQQAIVDAVEAALLAGTPVAGGRVYEGRDRAMPTGVASQVLVWKGFSEPTAGEIMGAPVDWLTEVKVLIKARRSGSDSAEKVADALWSDIYNRVMADSTLAGLVWDLTPGPLQEPERDEADTDVVLLEWAITCRHRTTLTSIAA